ncbi:hypothetical protein RHGRI_019202 [Rhododendron griersonianum]|uniref:Uncharacterized protein n=1 Tax=Rhododendron griersonianum TaxID=479676 RepID=A0AAV6JFY2_9ERIC|nr:hypothetical protein RHGRI_019202 [Rhododendron griersonianum]
MNKGKHHKLHHRLHLLLTDVSTVKQSKKKNENKKPDQSPNEPTVSEQSSLASSVDFQDTCYDSVCLDFVTNPETATDKPAPAMPLVAFELCFSRDIMMLGGW